jgi:hypothetical protein
VILRLSDCGPSFYYYSGASARSNAERLNSTNALCRLPRETRDERIDKALTRAASDRKHLYNFLTGLVSLML